MKYTFTTNSRVISSLLANYKDTFVAFCELINNSIQASASEIYIDISQTAEEILNESRITKIMLRDNGIGVSQSDFRKNIFEIGTTVKKGGKGIGRFAAFQIGACQTIETVAFDKILKGYVRTSVQLNNEDLEGNSLDIVELDVRHEQLNGEQQTYYQVIIDELWDDSVINSDKKKKIHSKLLSENLETSLFLQYPIEILNDKIFFNINGKKIEKEDFVIGELENRKETFNDLRGNEHDFYLTFINYKSISNEVKVFIRTLNNDIRTISFEFNYTADIPDQNSWLVYVDSVLFDKNQDIFRNLLVPGMFNETEHLIESLRSFIDKFFKEKYKEYFNFSKKLSDDTYYPYRQVEPSSETKKVVFNQLAYFIEQEHKLLSRKENLRKIVYPLVDQAINHGELLPIIQNAISLKGDHLKKFKNLLERADIEDVIVFSEEVAKKIQFLNFLHKIVYDEPAKHIKERKQFHKIIEKHLWLFGEQYKDIPILCSDTSLKRNLEQLRETHFKWEPDPKADNHIEIDPKLKDITDLFFYNERVLDDDNREVMVVELKRPSCRISQKELNQVQKYRFDIEENGLFSKDITYKIILVSSQLNRFAKSTVGSENHKSPFLYEKSKVAEIYTYVMNWADIIHTNRKKLSFLGNILKTKDRTTREVFEKDYPEIDLSGIISELETANN
ncbi:ATP-binding protein [Desulfatitalea tepidiphila]|uniref:ATP-binding protein n=1 Tax=Desulfatitalea tepidiphila TaxID=1185843 RepID=UPI0006B62EAF|nr:ATP-binding protein [Desulfatitalea tepidiphila]